PLKSKATAHTCPRWPRSVLLSPLTRSQTRTVPSALPEARVCPRDENDRLVTSPVWPPNRASCWVEKFQTPIEWSATDQARNWSSGEKATDEISPPALVSSCEPGFERDHTRSSPSSVAVAKRSDLFANSKWVGLPMCTPSTRVWSSYADQ